jgi:hypothetical protein
MANNVLFGFRGFCAGRAAAVVVNMYKRRFRKKLVD